MRNTRISSRLALAILATGAVTLAACSPSEQNDSTQSATDQASSAASNATESAAQSGSEDKDDQVPALTIDDAYVTAKPADKDMTGIFGTIENTSDKDIHLASVTGSVPGMYQLHVVKDGQMMEAKDGFTIKAGEELELRPGHEHIMLMDAHDELAAGDEISLELKDDKGETYELKNIPVRVQQSGNEEYGDHAGEDDHADHGDHDDHAEHNH